MVLTGFRGVTGKIVLVLLNYSALDSEQKKGALSCTVKAFHQVHHLRSSHCLLPFCRFFDYSFYSFLLISKNNWQIDKLTKAAKLWQ